MALKYGGSDQDEVSEEMAAVTEDIKVLNTNAKAEAAREERDALIAEASSGPAREAQAAARSSALSCQHQGRGPNRARHL